MYDDTMPLIIATTIIYIVVSWQEIVRPIKDKVQHILALTQESLPGLTLIGKSLLDCYNPESREKIEQVVDWFTADESHNIIYT